MESMSERVVMELVNYGFAGIMIILLMVILWKLYKVYKGQQENHTQERETWMKLSQKNTEEFKNVVVDCTSTLKEIHGDIKTIKHNTGTPPGGGRP